ncbi:hypothetical protein VTJ83DRAFT_7074 [Remersonia thermophila]|uniref:Oxidoreductase n=1 Tax=Remersonia thermophila TaxID=72144 RepID=A0ABR4D2G0_9PEZI
MAGVALLGAGIFAREQHLPAIQATPKLALKAIYSRRRHAAAALAALARDPAGVDVYYDVDVDDVDATGDTVAATSAAGSAADASLDALLRRADIAAVIVALPIAHQPRVVERALRAGKHVLSEKPVAGDAAEGKRLVERYEALLPLPSPSPSPSLPPSGGRPLWGVAENYRFMDSARYAAQRAREIGGRLVAFRLMRYGFVAEGNKYFATEWRKIPDYQGGFLLDGGVHFVAALRLLLNAVGEEIAQVAGFSALLEQRLLPVDTVHAVAVTRRGVAGTVAMSFGTEFKAGTEVELVTTNGAVLWTPDEVSTVARSKDGSGREQATRRFVYSTGVANEVAAFASAIETGVLEKGLSPREALKDLEVVQGLLMSGAEGGKVAAVASQA